MQRCSKYRVTEAPPSLFPHPEERPLGRVSKDEAGSGASWFETAQERRGAQHPGHERRDDEDYPAFSVIPPSTTNSIPVTYLDSSDARYSAALATSQASPIWPIGTCASRARHIASTSPAA